MENNKQEENRTIGMNEPVPSGTGQQTWLAEEEQQIQSNTPDYEKLPGMKFEENAITEFLIDFSEPFRKKSMVDMSGKDVIKAIIPVIHDDMQKNWWLNIKNPIYPEVIRAGRAGQTKFRILQTGRQQNTKYVMVK